MFYCSENQFIKDILKPLEKKVAIRYMEFPGEKSPIVFVRLAAVTRLENGPVYCQLHMPIIEGQATCSWELGYTFYPKQNWEKAAEMLCIGRNWEEMYRQWQTSEYKKPGNYEWLVQACRADKPFVANPPLGEFPNFSPIDLPDQMFLCKMYAVLHMIPCYLSTGLLHGMEHHYRREMIGKLQGRLSGYLRKANKT